MSMKPIAIRSETSPDTIEILWYIGKRCNFDCSYCSPQLHDSTSKDKSLEELLQAWKNIKKIAGSKKIALSISGGEPTLNPVLQDFLRALQKDDFKPDRIGITTNGTKSAEYYIEMMNHINSLTISIHLESVKAERYLKLIHSFAKSQSDLKKVKINLMASPGEIEKTKSLISALNTLEVSYIVRRIRPTIGAKNPNPQYQQEEIDFFENSDISFLAKKSGRFEIDFAENGSRKTQQTSLEAFNLSGHDSFKGWTCDAGIKNLTIWPEGEIYRCEKVPLIQHIPLNIYQNIPTKIDCKAITCPAQKCVCLADIIIPKFDPAFKGQ